MLYNAEGIFWKLKKYILTLKINITSENYMKVYAISAFFHTSYYNALKSFFKKCFLLVSTLILELQVIYIPHFYSIIDCILVIINIINTSVESANPFASKWICFNLSLESHSFLLIFSPHKTRE